MAPDGSRARSLATLVAFAFVLVIVGCGADAPVDKSEVALTVRSEGSPERRLLGQIYAQALKMAGYRVENAPESLQAKFRLEGLKAKQISGYPEYMSTSLFYDFGVEIEDIPTETRAAYRELKRNLEKQKLTAFGPATYGIENTVGMLRKVAKERGLQTNSDLKGKAEKMTIKAPTYCHVSVECLGGIEQHYDTAFEIVSYERALTPELTWWRAEPDFRYEVLEDGVADASILFNTDGRLARGQEKFVVLKDDKRIFPASNFVWVTSQDAVEEAGPDYERTIVDAQKGLTLRVIRELNAKMEFDGKSPAAVAAEYLEESR
jgi:osmoprotectant transport system substrate-binding protein